MVTHKTIPPLARGDSKPIDANKPFIVRDLPAELRNQIISYLVDCHRQSPIIRLPGAFFTRIGTQAHWFRKIVLDLCLLTTPKLYRSLAHPDRVKDGALERFEITPLLHAIWNLDLSVGVSLVNTRYFPPIHGLTDLNLNAPSTSAIFKSILGGQLELRKYGRLLYAVTIYGDSSGGEISWGTTNLCCDPPDMMIRELLPDIVPDLHHISWFTTEDGGARLRVHKREKALALLDLPQPIFRDIIIRVVRPTEGFVIDLDKDTEFNCGIIHVNKDIYHASFELILTTNCVHTGFDGFKNSRRFLRKTFDSYRYPSDSSHPKTLMVSPFELNTMKYTLKLEVQGPILLDDVRINILPFVMETAISGPWKGDELTIQVRSTDCSGASTMAASHTLGLQELRINILTALMKSFYLEKERQIVPDCWINSFGQVVQVVQVEDAQDIAGEAWELTSHLVENDCEIDHGCWETENCFDVLELHPLDRQYRRGDVHPGCTINGKQFFPFQQDPEEIMRYLMHNINDHKVFDFASATIVMITEDDEVGQDW
ncbi:hypothetical protein GT037_010845 [Alternaria burnsii]|uniref:Uncharacterized protein n=1 Tax=Alternaria burnsii TaxID=1187904 RepID=A0A8H7B1B0_9PLEO|nr:uncharacterized protein GT037_010845 [Alternaria burnsii]KAF7671064.1 hypothetical protein GT037_010845 [Alternaria burnsii]